MATFVVLYDLNFCFQSNCFGFQCLISCASSEMGRCFSSANRTRSASSLALNNFRCNSAWLGLTWFNFSQFLFDNPFCLSTYVSAAAALTLTANGSLLLLNEAFELNTNDSSLALAFKYSTASSNASVTLTNSTSYHSGTSSCSESEINDRY